MIAKRIAGATHDLGPPPGISSDDCGRLWVKAERDAHFGLVVESAWEPTPPELEQLNHGGTLILRIIGWQPPVALYVSPAAPEPSEEPA